MATFITFTSNGYEPERKSIKVDGNHHFLLKLFISSLFSIVSSFPQTFHSQINVTEKLPIKELNLGPLLLEATALSTVPQPLPTKPNVWCEPYEPLHCCTLIWVFISAVKSLGTDLRQILSSPDDLVSIF